MSATGITFDLQRCSLHDGPGIRTTIFLKGCPLRCAWCHNPEGIAPARQLFFAADRCVQCRACAAACPNGVHRFSDGVHSLDFSACSACGRCVEVCATRSLKIVGRETGVDEVMAMVTADLDFYGPSGGGMTLSGGEPLFQFSFALELLRRSRLLGIHTCVETSGYVAPAQFQAALPFIDVLLFDYKVSGEAEHVSFTGVSPRLILANLDLAYGAGTAIILRCPIIPGVNDNSLHFRALRELETKYPRLQGIEILPYHALGKNKRSALGASATFSNLGTTDPAVAQQWLDQLRALGCEKTTLG